ncbi:MAG: phage tail fiber protein [Limisphaerales bacterium]
MAGSKSDFLENALLDHVLGATLYVPPTSVWVALYTTAPTDAGGGVEVSGGAYTRIQINNTPTNWPGASAGVKSQTYDVLWAVATADWGTVVALAIFDAASGGNMLYWATVNTPKPVFNGDTAKIAGGQLIVTED